MTDFSNKATRIDNPCRWNAHVSKHLRASLALLALPNKPLPLPGAHVTNSIPPGLSPSSIPVLLNVPFREALQCVLI